MLLGFDYNLWGVWLTALGVVVAIYYGWRQLRQAKSPPPEQITQNIGTVSQGSQVTGKDQSAHVTINNNSSSPQSEPTNPIFAAIDDHARDDLSEIMNLAKQGHPDAQIAKSKIFAARINKDDRSTFQEIADFHEAKIEAPKIKQTPSRSKKSARKPAKTRSPAPPTIDALLALAKKGNPIAQNNLGFKYYHDKKFASAVHWYRKAANQNDAVAQYALGVCYDNGEGVKKDLNEAFKWYQKAADQNFAEAQYALGVCYDNGEGVRKDLAEAVKWYQKAADQNFAMAQNNLGVCYELGKGVKKDLNQAFNWYKKAADQNDAKAQFNLGNCYAHGEGVDKDLNQAKENYEKSLKNGYNGAYNALGWLYEIGYDGKVNCKKAEENYKLAIEKSEDNEASLFNLAWLYYHGLIDFRQKKTAFDYFQRAADKNQPEAEVNLAIMLYRGEGRKPDATKAIHYYRAAAKQELLWAQFIMAVSNDPRPARQNLLPPDIQANLIAEADQGKIDAQLNLAIELYLGIGFQRDVWESRGYVRLAQAQYGPLAVKKWLKQWKLRQKPRPQAEIAPEMAEMA